MNNLAATDTERDERLWSGYTCETCGWFELRPQLRDRGRLYCPHCERLGRGKADALYHIGYRGADPIPTALKGLGDVEPQSDGRNLE